MCFLAKRRRFHVAQMVSNSTIKEPAQILKSPETNDINYLIKMMSKIVTFTCTFLDLGFPEMANS